MLQVDVSDKIAHRRETGTAISPHTPMLLGLDDILLCVGWSNLRLRSRTRIGLKICDRASG